MPKVGNLEFESFFFDDEGIPMHCDTQDCSVGSYKEVVYESPATKVIRSTGACATCGFCGDIIDIFNPDSSRFVPDSPERYKSVAHRVLTGTDKGRRNLEILRNITPLTVAAIEQYSSGA